MAKYRVSRAYKKVLAEKSMELANGSLLGVVLVQFLPEHQFSLPVAIFGIITFLLLHIAAFILMQGGE